MTPNPENGIYTATSEQKMALGNQTAPSWADAWESQIPYGDGEGRWLAEDEEGPREATSIIACCERNEEEERVASKKQATSASRNKETAKTAGDSSMERLFTLETYAGRCDK